jgi:flagellar basal-body rod modification protein FlgD
MSTASTAAPNANAPNASAPNASATTTGRPTATNRTTIVQNFDTFLNLLTTQLKNQNPLEPLNTNEFTQQLVQFASVEQQLKSNETLTALLTSAQTSTLTNAAAFLGNSITADGKTTRLQGGAATWQLTAPRAASEAVMTIKDSTGAVVSTQKKALTIGQQSFTWDGRTSTGAVAPDGDYSITVTARDASGQDMAIGTQLTGTVDGVDLSGKVPTLLVGSSRIPLTSVTSVRRT